VESVGLGWNGFRLTLQAEGLGFESPSFHQFEAVLDGRNTKRLREKSVQALRACGSAGSGECGIQLASLDRVSCDQLPSVTLALVTVLGGGAHSPRSVSLRACLGGCHCFLALVWTLGGLAVPDQMDPFFRTPLAQAGCHPGWPFAPQIQLHSSDEG